MCCRENLLEREEGDILHKKIAIYAYTKLNLGDDLFIKILCNRYPNTKFYIVSSRKDSVGIKNIRNLIIIPSIPLVDKVLRKIKIKFSINSLLQKYVAIYCNASVHIGGSIFIQNNNWGHKAKEYQKKILCGKPYFIIGSNFGPFSDDEFRNMYANIFDQVTDVCFRDKYSKNLFSLKDNIRYAADVVFTYKIDNLKDPGNQVVISVIDLSNRLNLCSYKDNYIEKIVSISKKFISNNYRVILMGFCEAEGDLRAINEVISFMDENEKKGIIINLYRGNIEEAIEIINKSKCVIASRFHAMILGWVSNRVVFPIIYSNKSQYVIDDINFKGLHTSIQNIENISIDDAFSYLSTGFPIDISDTVQFADQQFAKLDKYLNEN